MANTVQLKRSSTAAKIPLTTNLALGELALNTTDGRLFTKKNVSSTDYIVEFLSTDSAFKPNVVAATTANITLSGTQTIDGVAVVAGDRVLVKNQTAPAENGVYVAAAGAWTRSHDMDTAADCAGARVTVRAGTTNGGKTFDTDFKATDTLGTTSMTWSRDIDAGAIDVDVQAYSAVLASVAGQSAGTGLLKLTSGTASLDTSTYLTANQSITLSGDISGTGSTAITTAIGTNKVTNAMLAQVATATFKGRTTASTGNVEDLTATQATALLNVFSSTLKGLAPASGGGTTNFLRADGTWAAPSAAGGVTSFSAGTTGLTPNSATTGAVTLAGTLGLANGGTGVTSAPAANAALMGFTSTATAAGTTVLTNTSSQYQVFTGTTTQTITLPVTTTLTTGWSFHICNNSTGNLTVNSSGGNLVITVLPGTSAMVTCILASGTTAASWEAGLTDFAGATGTGNVVLATSPTLVTPALGTPSSGTLTSCTGLPLTTGITGTLAVGNGGTGSTTAAGARSNLGVPNITVSTTAPGSPSVGDLWVDTN